MILKMSKGNKKLKNTLIFDLPAGKTCPNANECKSFVVMNAKGKTELKDDFTLAELVTGGFTLAELKDTFTIAELREEVSTIA